MSDVAYIPLHPKLWRDRARSSPAYIRQIEAMFEEQWAEEQRRIVNFIVSHPMDDVDNVEGYVRIARALSMLVKQGCTEVRPLLLWVDRYLHNVAQWAVQAEARGEIKIDGENIIWLNQNNQKLSS